MLLIGCESGQSPATPYTFSFTPPDSVTFVVELGMQRTTAQGEQQMIDSTWTLTRHLQRAIENGYEMTGVTDSISMFRNGQVVTDPIVHLFASAEITYLIDSTGLAYEVRGYDEVFAGLDDLVGADTANMIRQMVSPQALTAQELQTWNQKFGGFAGRQLTLGQPEIDSTFPMLPIEGKVASYGITELVDTVRINSRLCGKIKVASSTDPAQLAELTGKPLDEIVGLFGLTDELVAQASQRQAGSSSIRDWVLEFETMLSHSEASRQEIFYYELSQSGLPVRNQMIETQGKQFTYPEETAAE